MTEYKFDLDEVEAGIRKASGDAAVQAIDADFPADLVNIQPRQIEIHVQFSRWLLSEFNRGADPNRVAQAAGSIAAKLLETAGFNQPVAFTQRMSEAFQNTLSQRGQVQSARPLFVAKAQGDSE